MTKLCHNDGRGNDIRGGGGCRDGGRGDEDNYVHELVVETKNKEKEEEEMNNL